MYTGVLGVYTTHMGHITDVLVYYPTEGIPSYGGVLHVIALYGRVLTCMGGHIHLI